MMLIRRFDPVWSCRKHVWRGGLVLTVGTATTGCSPGERPVPDSAEDTPEPPVVEVEYIGHASFLIRSPGGEEVLLDPYASRVWIGYDFPGGLDPDVVAITHPHYDHDAGRYRGADFPWPDATVVDGPGQIRLGDVTITGVEGKHADPYGMEFGQLNTVMLVDVGGLRFAHVGDNGPLSSATLEGMGEVDILMMPMDSAYHILSPEETAEMRRRVPHRVLIPMHYRLPDLEPDPASPEDLGPVDPVVADEPRVRRLDAHRWTVSASTLPRESEIIVFRRSPAIPAPGRTGSP